MKKLFLMLLLSSALAGFSQSQVTVSGQVTENVSGTPVPMQPVFFTIMHENDSLNLIFDSVVTSDSGYYSYSFVLTGNFARIDISTPDCNGTMLSSSYYASPAINQVTQDFIICNLLICQAFFIPEQIGDYTFQFVDQSTGQNLDYFWDFGDNNFSNEQNPIHTFNASGDFEVCLIISSPDSTCFDLYCNQITAGSGPGCMAQFTYFPDSLPSGLSYQFLDLSSGNINSWTWEFGDGSFSQEQNPVHVFPEEGTYEVCLSISGPECQGTWCELVTVATVGDCYNYFTYQVAENTVTFEGNHFPSFPVIYSWDFGDGITADGPVVNHTYTQNGVYYVSLMTSDSLGCTAISSQSVVVGDTILFNQVFGQVFEGYLPMQEGYVMIASTQGNPGFQPFMEVAEVDSTGVFVFPYVPFGQFVLYAVPENSEDYLPTYYGGASHWAQASSFNSMESGMLYTINLNPVRTLPVFGSGSISGNIGETNLRDGMLQLIQVILYNASFEIIGFTSVSPGGDFRFDDLAEGLYYIYPEMPGINSNYMAVQLTDIMPTGMIYLSFDGTSILGEEELSPSERDGKVYPNPATSYIRISFESRSPAALTIQVTDMTGRVCFSDIYQGKNGLVEIFAPLADLMPGVYLVRVIQGDGMLFSRRVIKR